MQAYRHFHSFEFVEVHVVLRGEARAEILEAALDAWLVRIHGANQRDGLLVRLSRSLWPATSLNVVVSSREKWSSCLLLDGSLLCPWLSSHAEGGTVTPTPRYRRQRLTNVPTRFVIGLTA